MAELDIGAPEAGGSGPGGRLGTGEVRRSSIAYLAWACLLSPRLMAALLRYLGTVLRFFFLSQFRAKLRPGDIPLARVDHPLDALVPFKPEMAGVYLGFIRTWLSALSCARRKLGREADGAAVAFMDGLSACYLEAYGVYRRRVSTTRRPSKAANAELRMIYLMDPHLYCVPSLHVMIVCYAFLAYREMFDALGRPEEGREGRAELHRRAVAITDSVVYVKQHSVNCIPAALYALGCLRADFGRAEAKAFIAELFSDPALARDRAGILSYMAALYDRFMDESEASGGDYKEVLLRFLAEYPETPAT